MASIKQPDTLEELEDLIDNCPIIDHHVHAVAKKKTSAEFKNAGFDLLSITSEASGAALQHATSTLAHHRAVGNLIDGFKHVSLEPINDWEGYQKFRDNTSEDVLNQIHLSGLQTMLIDDGIRSPQGIILNENSWHDQFLKTPSRRILRIETIAEDLMKEASDFHSWAALYEKTLKAAVQDPQIVGFKSIIAYRTGFVINLNILEYEGTRIIEAYDQTKHADSSKPARINNLYLNSFVLLTLIKVLKEETPDGFTPKPVQFHTGLGDNDLLIKEADPALLQPLINKCDPVPIVLLHGGYPFTRNAGYLASTYNNVYLDLGLVFPMISQSGQEAVIEQGLELGPSTKLMWSTDGYLLGERYFLAVKQLRDVLKVIVKRYHHNHGVSITILSTMVMDILFNTANKLYSLGLELHVPKNGLQDGGPRNHSADPTQTGTHRGRASLQILAKFLQKHPDIVYLRIDWLDYSAILRTRILKIKHVIAQLEKSENGSILGTAQAGLGLLVNCVLAEGVSAIGEHRIVPDFNSLRLHPSGHASVMCWMEDDSQNPLEICPRTILRNAIERAETAGLNGFKVGFEIEFVLLKQDELDRGNIVPLSSFHTWSASRAFQSDALNVLEDIDRHLSATGIDVEQIHSEAAKGQYEIILSPLPPLQAVDTLTFTREVIQTISARHGYRATLLPKPFDGECGSAAHMHMSFQPVGKQWSFFAGVLENIRAINALTLGSELSYERIIAGFWAGGVWACWGKQNREAPLRLVEEDKAHWEIKTADGMANMYLAAAGILTAGTIGVQQNKTITAECSDVDSSSLSAEERKEKGIEIPMVKSIEEALEALFEKDGETPTKFSRQISPLFAQRLAAVKRAEKQFIYSQFVDKQDGTIDVSKRRAWAAQWY